MSILRYFVTWTACINRTFGIKGFEIYLGIFHYLAMEVLFTVAIIKLIIFDWTETQGLSWTKDEKQRF